MPQNRKIKSNINKKKSKRAAKTVLGGGVSCLARLHGGSMAAQRRDWAGKRRGTRGWKTLQCLGTGNGSTEQNEQTTLLGHYTNHVSDADRMFDAANGEGQPSTQMQQCRLGSSK